jgi:hypothetical protein
MLDKHRSALLLGFQVLPSSTASTGSYGRYTRQYWHYKHLAHNGKTKMGANRLSRSKFCVPAAPLLQTFASVISLVLSVNMELVRTN